MIFINRPSPCYCKVDFDDIDIFIDEVFISSLLFLVFLGKRNLRFFFSICLGILRINKLIEACVLGIRGFDVFASVGIGCATLIMDRCLP